MVLTREVELRTLMLIRGHSGNFGNLGGHRSMFTESRMVGFLQIYLSYLQYYISALYASWGKFTFSRSNLFKDIARIVKREG